MFLAKEERRTIAELLSDPKTFDKVLKAAESSFSDCSTAQFLFIIEKELSTEQKRASKATLVKLLVQLASQISARGIRSTERFLTGYRPGLEEIEVENTLENIMLKKHVDYEDLVMVGRKQKKRAVVLMIDTSNSMKRDKLLIAILAIGVLAFRLQGENFAVVSFNAKAKVLKPIEKQMSIDKLLEEMLEIEAGGSTNVSSGLELGFEQLSKNIAHEKIGIIVTDGWVTQGKDPLETAKKFPMLHVIQVPLGYGGSDTEMCENLAKEGRGKRIYVSTFTELPRAVLEILK
jgi:Mg-chelatase subunit ChlD